MYLHGMNQFKDKTESSASRIQMGSMGIVFCQSFLRIWDALFAWVTEGLQVRVGYEQSYSRHSAYCHSSIHYIMMPSFIWVLSWCCHNICPRMMSSCFNQPKNSISILHITGSYLYDFNCSIWWMFKSQLEDLLFIHISWKSWQKYPVRNPVNIGTPDRYSHW